MKQTKHSRSWLFFGLLAVSCFGIGFSLSLVLHWSIRSPSELAKQTIAEAEASLAQNEQAASYQQLQNENQELLNTVGRLESELDRQSDLTDMSEGHARALVGELQQFRSERDKLFAQLQARNQKLIDKIEQLDSQINEQFDKRLQLDQESDHAQRLADITSLLSYPHPLNDLTQMNAALSEQPIRNSEFVQQRFELIMQIPRYDLESKISEQLLTIHEQLNKQHSNDTQLRWLHCTDGGCEVQVSMTRQQAYYDYAQQWLDMVSQLAPLRNSQGVFVVDTQQNVLVSLQVGPEG